VEPTLVQPTFVIDFPIELSPLAKRKARESTAGRPLSRGTSAAASWSIAYSELNDRSTSWGRFREQGGAAARRRRRGPLARRGLVRALEYGMPPTAGEGIGIDRLVMLFADQPSIREVILSRTCGRKRPAREAQPANRAVPRLPLPRLAGGHRANPRCSPDRRWQRVPRVAASSSWWRSWTGFQDGIRDRIISASPHLLVFQTGPAA